MTRRMQPVIGLMSGTSMDGVDAALIYTDGVQVRSSQARLFLPYDEAQKRAIRSAVEEAARMYGRQGRSRIYMEAQMVVDAAHITAVRTLMDRNALTPGDVSLIGYHGHTIYHAPDDGITQQIGDGWKLQQASGVEVVGDFRTEDVARGGQGAPLAPLYHFARASQHAPCAVVNIGGVSNVTFIPTRDMLDMRAFDTGPGNALMDDVVRDNLGLSYDEGGQIAAKGSADEAMVARWLENGYFHTPPPKSLDRDVWRACLDDIDGYSAPDMLATLALFTARSIAISQRAAGISASQWYITGGGRRNAHLMSLLPRELTSAKVRAVEDLGICGDFMEAEAFAFLAMRKKMGLNITLAHLTGG